MENNSSSISATSSGVGSFRRRFVANLIDGALASILAGFFIVMNWAASGKFFAELGALASGGEVIAHFTPLLIVSGITIGLVTQVLWAFLLSKNGATPGKYLLDLRVISTKTNEYLTFGQALARTLLMNYGAFLLGFIIPTTSLFSQKRRHAVDNIMHTQVIHLHDTRQERKKHPIWGSFFILISACGVLSNIAGLILLLKILGNPTVWQGPSTVFINGQGQYTVNSGNIAVAPEAEEEGPEAAPAEETALPEEPLPSEETTSLKRYMNFSLSPTERAKVEECRKNADVDAVDAMMVCRCYVMNLDPEIDDESQASLEMQGELLESCKKDVSEWATEADKGAE